MTRSRRTARATAATSVVLLVAALAACSSARPEGVGYPVMTVSHDVDSVRVALNITSPDGGKTWRMADGDSSCQVRRVLVSADQVRQAMAAGEKVAVNAAGTIGLSITGARGSTCLKDLTKALTGIT